VAYFIALAASRALREAAGSYPPPGSVFALSALVISISASRVCVAVPAITAGDEVTPDQSLAAQIPTHTRQTSDI
jgi:hypothetical protein